MASFFKKKMFWDGDRGAGEAAGAGGEEGREGVNVDWAQKAVYLLH